MAQRISHAKSTVSRVGVDRLGEVRTVMRVLYVAANNEVADNDLEYLAPRWGGNGVGIEYIATEPGALQLGLWSGDTTDCSGSPVVTRDVTVSAGSRSYVYWYGPAGSPAALVLPIPAPKPMKYAVIHPSAGYGGGGVCRRRPPRQPHRPPSRGRSGHPVATAPRHGIGVRR